MKQRILLKGKDGIDLLSRITTLDFRRLSPGSWNPGLILNPQGKIVCYFEAKAVSSDQLEVTFEDTFLELLDQFTFGERYQIETLPADSEQKASEHDRIQSRTPLLGKEFLNNGETNPLEINLQNAIHDQKGCYPGQEVIEKMIAIGSPAKKLCLVELKENAPDSLSTPINLDFGKLTSYEKPFGLAIVRKTHAAPGTILKNESFSAQVIQS